MSLETKYMTQTCHPVRPTFRRLTRLLIPLGLATLWFSLLVWGGLASNFDHRFKLSSFIVHKKARNPDIAAAGDYVAAVWSEGYNDDEETKDWGHIYLKSAHTTDGWEERIRVFEAGNSNWAREPRLVFDPNDPTKVHVVWAQATSGCESGGSSCQWTSIRYTTCTLTGPDSCGSVEEVAASQSNTATPVVAVASGGQVHVVWYTSSSSNLKYSKKPSGGSFSSPDDVADGRNPDLVYANNKLHLVWDAGETISYQRDNPGDSGWSNELPSTKSWSPHSNYEAPSFPAVGGNGAAIYVVWTVKEKLSSDFALAFDFSDDGGTSWQDTSGGDGLTIPGNDDDFPATTRYRSDTSGTSYLYGLKPDVVVTSTGVATTAYAHVAWHRRETGIAGSDWDVLYAYLPGIEADDWTSPENVSNDNENAGDPALAIGSSLDQTHVAFVEKAHDGASPRNVEVWYVGANGNRENDSNVNEGFHFMPIIYKNY